jgi:Protein of unknown function with HXXEE motif
MDRCCQMTFLLLVAAQVAHAMEEYIFALYDVFPVVHAVSSLVGRDPGVGFIVLNSLVVSFGIWCYLIPIRSGWASARILMWLWVCLEFINGLAHPVLALRAGGYFPGVATAPLLFFLSIVLAACLVRSRGVRCQQVR